jgi:hypothetical protein
MTPEEMAARLRELINQAQVGPKPILSVDQGHLIELVIVTLEQQSAEIKRMKIGELNE